MGKLRPLWTPGGSRGSTGSITATELQAIAAFSGWSNPETLDFTFSWRIAGGIVSLYIGASTTLLATSNATTMIFGAGTFPTEVRPSNTRTGFGMATDNTTVNAMARAQMSAVGTLTLAFGTVSGTAITFPAAGGWTASGTKGLQASWTFTYPL